MEVILWILGVVIGLVIGKGVYDRITHNNRMKILMDEIDSGLSEVIKDLNEAKEIVIEEMKKPETTVQVDTKINVPVETNTGTTGAQSSTTTPQKTKVVKSKPKTTPKKPSKTKVKKA